MKKVILSLVVFAAIAMALVMMTLSSCHKSESTVTPAPPGNEFLTTVMLRCINQNPPYDTSTAIWRDLNPNNANLQPDTSLAVLTLHANTTYLAYVGIIDESVTTNFGTINLADTIGPNFLMDTALQTFTLSNPYTKALNDTLGGAGYSASTVNYVPLTTNNVTAEIRQRQNYHLICFTMTGGTPALSSNLTVTRLDYDGNTPPLQVGLDDIIQTVNATTGGVMNMALHHQPNVKNGTCDPGTDDFNVNYSVIIH